MKYLIALLCATGLLLGAVTTTSFETPGAVSKHGCHSKPKHCHSVGEISRGKGKGAMYCSGMADMIKLLNWLNGIRERLVPKTSDAIAPLPQGDAPLTKYQVIHTRPLSEKLKDYCRGRGGVIGDPKK